MYDLSAERPSTRAQIKSANIPVRFAGLELSDLGPYKGETLDAAKKWLDRLLNGAVISSPGAKLCGKGLLLIGKPGHGKTTLSCTLVQEALRKAPQDLWGGASFVKRPAFFIDYPKLLRIQQRSWKDDAEDDRDLMDAIYGEAGNDSVKILVLDDLGKEYRTASGWAENVFDAVLRARYNAGLPTIVTTNVPLNDWGSVYGEPMESFAHEAFIPLSVVSLEGDRRK